jgi:hypothetical protein
MIGTSIKIWHLSKEAKRIEIAPELDIDHQHAPYMDHQQNY